MVTLREKQIREYFTKSMTCLRFFNLNFANFY